MKDQWKYFWIGTGVAGGAAIAYYLFGYSLLSHPTQTQASSAPCSPPPVSGLTWTWTVLGATPAHCVAPSDEPQVMICPTPYSGRLYWDPVPDMVCGKALMGYVVEVNGLMVTATQHTYVDLMNIRPGYVLSVHAVWGDIGGPIMSITVPIRTGSQVFLPV